MTRHLNLLSVPLLFFPNPRYTQIHLLIRSSDTKNMQFTRSHLATLLLLLLSFPLISQAKQPKPAPDFAINDTLKLSDLKGKVVYIDFWASWCVPCRKSFPWLNKMTAHYQSKDFKLISVNLDENRQDADKFLKQYPAKFSVTYDPAAKIAESYNVIGMPSSYLIDKNGNIAATHVGFFKSKTDKYQQQIDALLK